MAADDIAVYFNRESTNAVVVPMEDCDVASLAEEPFAIIVTSTYGEGELPETTQPFYDALQKERPDLSGLCFAAFGLGDSAYATYGNGIDLVADLLKSLGARQLGETGRHDAAKSEPLARIMLDWLRSLDLGTAGVEGLR